MMVEHPTDFNKIWTIWRTLRWSWRMMIRL